MTKVLNLVTVEDTFIGLGIQLVRLQNLKYNLQVP
jgi:hypothetical protein